MGLIPRWTVTVVGLIPRWTVTKIFLFFFFPQQVEERKQFYLDSYDIVLVKDETMEVPNAVLRYLTGSESPEN